MNLQSSACQDLNICIYFCESSSQPLLSKLLLAELFFPLFLGDSMTQQIGLPTPSLPGPALACALPSMSSSGSVYPYVCFPFHPELPNHHGTLGDLGAKGTEYQGRS